MKNKTIFLIFFFTLTNLCFGKENASSERPLILTSIAPYKFLVEKLAGDTVTVFSIVPPHSDPHTYEPTPKHVSKIKKSVLWIKIGEPFETIYEKTLKSSLHCHVLDIRTGIDLLSYAGCSHDNHKKATFDAHIWLSPKLLKQQAASLLRTLCFLFPDNEEFYKKNYTRLILQLDTLHTDIEKIFSERKPEYIAVVHPAFAYFGKDYRITQISVENGRSMDPSLKYLQAMMTLIQKHCIKTILLQNNLNNKSGCIISQKLQLHPVFVDPYKENVIENLKHLAQIISQS